MRINVLRYLSDKVLPTYKPSELGKAVTDSMLQYPDDWKSEGLTIKHIPSDIQIWGNEACSSGQFYRVPGDLTDTERANKCLSSGDIIAVKEIIKMLNKRQPPDSPVNKIIDLLKKPTK